MKSEKSSDDNWKERCVRMADNNELLQAETRRLNAMIDRQALFLEFLGKKIEELGGDYQKICREYTTK